MAAAGVLGVVLGVKRAGTGEGVFVLSTLVPLFLGGALIVAFVRRRSAVRIH